MVIYNIISIVNWFQDNWAHIQPNPDEDGHSDCCKIAHMKMLWEGCEEVAWSAGVIASTSTILA